MWGKVPCEQQLDTGESALSHGGNLYQTCGVSFSLAHSSENGEPQCRRKGIGLIFPNWDAEPRAHWFYLWGFMW